MEKRSRRKFSSEFKAKVVLEALWERQTLEELSRRYEVHQSQITQWKKGAVSKLSVVFGSSNEESTSGREDLMEKLFSQIGQLKVENDFLKKKLR